MQGIRSPAPCKKVNRKTMKKIYFDPEMEVIELKIGSTLLSASPGSDIPGGDDGGIGGSSSDPTDPGLIGGGEGL